MKQKHECEDVLSTLDLSIETDNDGTWMLYIGDKETGDWSLTYDISCCPFCRAELEAVNGSEIDALLCKAGVDI